MSEQRGRSRSCSASWTTSSRRLERGDVPLDEAVALWRRGEELHRACVERLDRAELEIEELRQGDGSGRDSETPEG